MQKTVDLIDISEEQLNIIESGKKIYNYFRNCDIRVYTSCFNGTLELLDKKSLALYLSIIYNKNFFSDILKKVGYTKFTNFSCHDTSIQYYEHEFQQFIDLFQISGDLEIVVLYLLEIPLIKGLILKEGYSVSKLKLEVCEYYAKKLANTINDKENKQKVLTK